MFQKVLALIFAFFASIFGFFQPIRVTQNTAPVATTTFQATTTISIATTTPQTKIKQIAKKIVKNKLPVSRPLPTVQTPSAITQTPPQPVPPPDFGTINASARPAIVNIFCTANGDTLDPISGTGVIIDPQGIILTNAHVAEYLLLKNYREPNFIQCVVRTGSPAINTYNADLLYISPQWVRDNVGVITSQNPTGTGENDFAFLRITSTVSGAPISSVPYIPPHIAENITVNEPVVLISYPAGFLGGISIAEDLSASSAVTTIQDVFTFGQSTIDVISVGGTIVSQKGSSGGAVIDGNSTLIGLISTSDENPTTAERTLHAITLPYISRTLESDLGQTLPQFLSGDLPGFETNFLTNTAPGLTKLLTDQLNQQ